MDVAQLFLRTGIHAPVDSPFRAALTHPVLYRCDHTVAGACILVVSFKSKNHLGGKSLYQLRVLRITLIESAPAGVARHGYGWGKRPIDPAGCNLQRCNSANVPDELRIISGAKPYVVRKNCGPEKIIVAMHRIGCPGKGNGKRPSMKAFLRSQPIGLNHLCPFCCRAVFVLVRPNTGSVQGGAKFINPYVVRLQLLDLWLNHLADLLL